MVARYSLGTNISGALKYNLDKVQSQKGEVVANRNIPFGVMPENIDRAEAFFRINTEQNQRCKKNCLHISVNLSNDDDVSNQQMSQMAGQLMRTLKMSRHPAVVIRHYDAGHPHMHIVTTLIDDIGKRVPIAHLGYTLRGFCESEEIKHNLTKTGKNKAMSNAWGKKVSLEPIRYPDSDLAKRISAVVDMTSRYKFSNTSEWNAILKKFNIKAIEIGPNGQKVGYMFTALSGNRSVGTPIKSRHLKYSKRLYSRVSKSMEREAAVRQNRAMAPKIYRQQDGYVALDPYEYLGKSSGTHYIVDNDNKEIWGVDEQSATGSDQQQDARSRIVNAQAADYGSVSENQSRKKKRKKKRL